MKDLISCIEGLRLKLDKLRKEDLKEYPTRTIFIDPILQALGWDIRDTDEVQLEYPTIDGKSVDYAPKVNRKPVLFIEAKSLNDPLTDVKSITQIVGYAANAGVKWCILTNGVTYKVFCSTEKAEAPDKLLFEVSIDPKESEGKSVQQIAEQFNRFSRDAMAQGILDDIGEQIFTMGKIRKALDKIFLDPPQTIIKLIRSKLGDESIKPIKLKEAIKRLWTQSIIGPQIVPVYNVSHEPETTITKHKRSKDYGEEYHIKGKPREIIELYRIIDKFCRELNPTNIEKRHLALYISYAYQKSIFCCIRVQKSGLRIWLKLNYSELENPSHYVRDVSNIGHWGVGNVEIGIDNLEQLEYTKSLINLSFNKNRLL